MSKRIQVSLPDDLHSWLLQSAKFDGLPLATEVTVMLTRMRRLTEVTPDMTPDSIVKALENSKNQQTLY